MNLLIKITGKIILFTFIAGIVGTVVVGVLTLAGFLSGGFYRLFGKDTAPWGNVFGIVSAVAGFGWMFWSDFRDFRKRR